MILDRYKDLPFSDIQMKNEDVIFNEIYEEYKEEHVDPIMQNLYIKRAHKFKRKSK